MHHHKTSLILRLSTTTLGSSPYKVIAERARNAWWSDRAAEAERRALVAEQQGREGSLS